MSTADIHRLARLLGGEAHGRGHISAPGPGHSPHDRSLSVTVTDDGSFVVYNHADPRNWQPYRDHVKRALGLPTFSPSPQTSRRHETVRSPASTDNHEKAMRIWAEAISPRGELPEIYLASRGLFFPDDVLVADVLRFHPDCPFGRLRRPAMIAVMKDIVTDEPRGIHRTALRRDGKGKADMPDGGPPKRMLGPAHGAAVKLVDDDGVTGGLGIAEGIETALAVLRAGFSPMWAVGSAGAIRTFPVLHGVEHLTIFGDADENGRGQEDARACARRWVEAGRYVTIMLPPNDGSDWNDAMKGEGGA